MKILIDIGHPAHVHIFKNLAWLLSKKGHSIFFTTRDKECELVLLESYDFPYKSFGKHFISRIGKIFGLIKFNIQLLAVSLRIRPDIYLSHGSIYAAQVSWFLRRPHISLEDTGNDEQVNLYLPFTPIVLTSDVFTKDYGRKQIRYKSHHEIAYLHPNYFIPDLKFKESINLKDSDKYVILRFVSWNATHDKGQKGIGKEMKLRIIETLSKEYIVYISSESELSDEFEKYRISFPPDKMHDALYHSELFIGEGTTMAMEAAILGTPSIYVNSLQYGCIEDMESYGLLYGFENDTDLMSKIVAICNTPQLKAKHLLQKEKLFSEKIDLTALLVWFVEKYPNSINTLKDHPDYQYNFK